MNDKLLLENYLLVLKSTVEVYVHGTLESSNEKVRSLLKMSLDEIMKCQSKTYDEMTNYGWYTINNVPSKTIKQTLNSLEKSN